MKYYLPPVSALLLSAALSSAAPIEINGVAATVNSKVITKKEVNMYMAPAVDMLQAKYPRRGPAYTKELKKVQEGILDKLIESKIVLSELENRGAALPDHVIDAEVRRIVTENFNGNEAEFRKNLENNGMTMRSFKESQKEQILIQAFRAQQFNDVAPATPEEVSAHYAERRHKLRDRTKDRITYKKVFVLANDPAKPGFTPENNLSFAEDLVKQLKNGADFDTIARKNSAGAFAEQGGLWEDQSRLDLAPSFAEIVFDAPNNEIIGPIKDPAGFIIVKVLDKTFGPSPSFSEVQDRMRQEVKIEKRSARYKKWIENLKRKAMIKRKI